MNLRAMVCITSLALGGGALAGCGGDDEEKTTGAPASKDKPQPAETQAGTGKEVVSGLIVSMQDIEFDPKSANPKVGETVKWTNDDGVPHDVTARSGAKFASKTIGPGGTYEYKAEKAGTIQYTCTIHPGMDGTLVVK